MIGRVWDYFHIVRSASIATLNIFQILCEGHQRLAGDAQKTRGRLLTQQKDEKIRYRLMRSCIPDEALQSQ